jgi:hypothetical protein
MNLTAEIRTGQRRIVKYLLSYVQKAGSEKIEISIAEKLILTKLNLAHYSQHYLNR